METTRPLIYELMPRVMADIGSIPKAHRNKAQSYDFRSIEDALNVVQPVLVKYGMSLSFRADNYCVDTIKESKAGSAGGERTIYRASLTMSVTFYAADGSSITSVSAGEGMDYGGDKATNKAQSAAFKYAMFLGLCIPVQPATMDDSDRDQTPPAGNGQVQQQPAAATPQTAPPASAYSAPASMLCTADHAREIVELAKAAGLSREQLVASLAKRGVQKVGELKDSQAVELIAALRRKASEVEANAVF